MKKDELRKIYLAKRKALSEIDYAQKSKQLSDLFFLSVNLSAIEVLHIYLPIKEKREPDTWLIINRIQKEFPHIQLSVPKVENDTMENYFFEGLHQLKKNPWGILEPQQGILTPLEKIDLVIVPLLTFDLQGHRVGYGKGFYDRLLKECETDCKKIGLSLFEPVDRIEDSSSHDERLNACFTPDHGYPF